MSNTDFPGANQFDKAYLVSLHGHLSNFHESLARRVIPHSYEAEGCEDVATVMQLIEKLTEETV